MDQQNIHTKNKPQEMQSFLKLYIQIFVDPLTSYLLEMKSIQLTLIMISSH